MPGTLSSLGESIKDDKKRLRRNLGSITAISSSLSIWLGLATVGLGSSFLTGTSGSIDGDGGGDGGGGGGGGGGEGE